MGRSGSTNGRELHIKVQLEELKVGDHQENLDTDATSVLKLILIEMNWRVCTGFVWLMKESVAAFCEHGYEPSDSVIYSYMSSS
jgi:hypothetical protein